MESCQVAWLILLLGLGDGAIARFVAVSVAAIAMPASMPRRRTKFARKRGKNYWPIGRARIVPVQPLNLLRRGATVGDELVYVLLGSVPDGEQMGRIAARLLAAVVLGAVVGIQREIESKPAGLRTHILVTLAATIFVIVPLEAGMSIGDLSRVIQGVATGIGFIGAGAILKLHNDREIHGLTTAATIWMATAIGIAIGLGHVLLAALSVTLTWIVLSLMVRIDAWIAKNRSGGRHASNPAAKRAARVE